jgi:preprotein translocase SecE subunit
MTIADDPKTNRDDDGADAPEGGPAVADPEEGSGALATAAEPTLPVKVTDDATGATDEDEDEEADDGAPAQLGGQRFVYAAYFAGAVAVAFLLSKALSYGWQRLSTWKPQVGEPDEMICVASAAIIGALVAFYYYRDEKTRTLAEEVASELGKVTWPTRDEVVNGTFVVVVTTFAATAFFALMDRFWGFVTNLVYGA